MQYSQPGAFPHAKAAQLHGVDDIFRPHNRADHNRDNHWGEFGDLAKDAPAQLVDFKTAGALCVERCAKVTRYRWQKTKREINRIGKSIRYSHTFEGYTHQPRMGGEGNGDGQHGDSEVAQPLRNHKSDALYAKDQRFRHKEGRFTAETNKRNAEEHMLMRKVYALNN